MRGTAARRWRRRRLGSRGTEMLAGVGSGRSAALPGLEEWRCDPAGPFAPREEHPQGTRGPSPGRRALRYEKWTWWVFPGVGHSSCLGEVWNQNAVGSAHRVVTIDVMLRHRPGEFSHFLEHV